MFYRSHHGNRQWQSVPLDLATALLGARKVRQMIEFPVTCRWVWVAGWVYQYVQIPEWVYKYIRPEDL
jgi:hypothetical protein